MAKIGSVVVGACGEHYVASYLSGLGLIVALPRAGVKGSDLFVADPDHGRPLRVQVKTARDPVGKDKKGSFVSWDTGYKVVDRPDDTLWFAYVNLNGWPEAPQNHVDVYFVPSSAVIAHMKAEQKPEASRTFFWLYEPDAAGYRGTAGLEKMRASMGAPASI